MRSAIMVCIRERLETTVRALCPIIERKVCANTKTAWNEYALRRELVACILGSQVRHEMAVSALERIEQAGLIDDSWWHKGEDRFESQLSNLLSSEAPRGSSSWGYRFPKVRAHQLTETRNTLAKRSLSERLSNTSNPKQIRRQLVADICGIGPKQASMFLRNIGITYDLAILDTHVLHFLDMQNLLCIRYVNISTIPAYERTEQILLDYANSLGYPVGYLDWAIWATMRAAMELGL
jgi:N-glycosylase/DNA lyase